MAAHLIKLTLLFILLVLLSNYGFGQKIVPSIIEESSNQLKQNEENTISSNNTSLGIQATNYSEERAGFVVCAYLGTAKTASTNLRISQPTFNTDLTFEDVQL